MTKNDIVICYSFFGDKMKRIYLLIFIMFIVVILLSIYYFNNNVMISESNISYIDDNDIIGSIKISSINYSNILLQGLDNKYYLNHNYLKEINDNGEVYLDYQGDLINNNNPIIYSKINNIKDINKIRINDKIEVFYLYKLQCYKVINSSKNKDLEFRIYDDNNIKKIYAKKIKC